MGQRDFLWWMVLPVLPFLAAIGLLQMLSDGGIDLIAAQMTEDTLILEHGDLRNAGGVLLYAAIVLFHSIICLGVMGYASLLLTRMPGRARARSLAVLAGTILFVALVNLAARDMLIGALNLTYRTTCEALVTAGAWSHLTPKACDDGPLSPLAVLAVTPYLLGILAAAIMSAITATAYDGAESEADLLAGAEQVDRAFQATAFLLATSVAALVAFYRLPLPLIADETLRALVAGYGQGMALFWGVGFTLTLMAIFAPAALLLQRRLSEVRVGNDLSRLRASLAEQGPRKRLRDALTLLAPLLVGSAATLIDLLVKALG